MFLFTLISSIFAVENAGIGGFVTFGFNYDGIKTKLLSQLSISIKTPPPQNSNVDTAEVQPTGYWIVPTPSHHELVVSVKAPEGLVIEPQTHYIQYPFNTNVNFQIIGFSAIGQIYTKGPSHDLIRVFSQLTVEVTNGADIKITKVTNDGTYSIGPLPPGDYTVSLKDAVAAPKQFSIINESVKLDGLLITDWPQNGVVAFPENVKPYSVSLTLTTPNSDANINTNVKTDENGKFSIKGLRVGHYILKSAVSDIVISPLSFQISAQESPKPLTMKYEGIRVHGVVEYPNGEKLSKAEVTLNPGNFKATTNENGEFVFPVVHRISQPILEIYYPYHKFAIPTLPPIEFEPISHLKINIISAQICGKVECSSADLTFSGGIKQTLTVSNGTFCVSAPISQPVNINAVSQCGFEHNTLQVSAPTDSVKFARIKATVNGRARCLGDCDTTTVFLLNNEQHSYETKILSNGKVEFSEVEFGRYVLSIRSGFNTIWSVLQKDLFVSEKIVNVEGEIGEQTGFVYNVTASHEMKVKSDGKIFDLKRGLNTIQVRSTIIEPTDCHIFKAIDLKSSSTGARIIAESIERKVVVVGDKDVYSVFLNGVELVKPYVFTQQFDRPNKVSITTKAPYFAIPTELEVSAASVSSCDETDVKFEVIVGVEYAGSIQPPIEGVVVTAVLDNGKKVISTAQTSETGVFSLGSFPSNQDITLKAVKQGYKFTASGEKGRFDFKAEKLSSLLVHFEVGSNSSSSQLQQQNLVTKGILMSISRLDNFAHHVVTESADDTLISDLEAGTYFLKPIFREHEFTPPQIELSLVEGTQQNVTFEVVRVQFGISGEVRRITGEFEPDVEIEANYGNGEKQITVTDANGRFRIGGLNPNQTVTLLARASETSPAVDRITPPQMKVKMGTEELRGVRFLSIKPQKTFDILGELVVEADFLPTMNVALLTPNSNVVERFTFPSKLSNFFYFTNLTQQKYTVIVANTRQVNSVVCPKQEVEFNQPAAKIRIVCEVAEAANKSSSEETDSRIASTIAFLAVIVWISFFNIGKLKGIANDMVFSQKKKTKKNKQQ